MKAVTSIILSSVLLSEAAIAQNNAQPSLMIQNDRIVASGFSPGATIVFYSVALVGDGYSTSTRSRSARITDDDRDGTVTFNYPGRVPFRSVWIAANEANGDYALASPDGYHHKNGVPPTLHKHGASVDEIAWPGHVMYLFYLHPGKGAWVGYSSDGSSYDSDGKADSTTSLALSKLRPVATGDNDKPTDLKPGGTLFIIDGYNLQTVSLRLDGGILNGAK